MKETLVKLLKVKSIVTILLTVCMAALLLGRFNPSSELLALFSTVYGSVITYFFTRKDGTDSEG